jgi:hypothetical protein
MRVYELEFRLDSFQWLMPSENDDWNAFGEMLGVPVADEWVPKRMIVASDTQERPAGDFPHLMSGVPVFSERAVAALKPYLTGNGELLPLETDFGEFWAMNVTTVLDALDEEQSDIQYASFARFIWEVRKYVFRPEVIGGAHMFKIPQLLTGPVFVTDGFVDTIDRVGLQGFDCKLVWSSNS